MMYPPFGFRHCAPLPRVYTCRCQTLLRISWWVKCPAALHPIPVYNKVLAAMLMQENSSIHPSTSISPSLYLQSVLMLLLSIQSCVLLACCVWGSFFFHLTDRWFSFWSVSSLLLTHWAGGQRTSLPLKTPLKQNPGSAGLIFIAWATSAINAF